MSYSNPLGSTVLQRMSGMERALTLLVEQPIHLTVLILCSPEICLQALCMARMKSAWTRFQTAGLQQHRHHISAREAAQTLCWLNNPLVPRWKSEQSLCKWCLNAVCINGLLDSFGRSLQIERFDEEHRKLCMTSKPFSRLLLLLSLLLTCGPKNRNTKSHISSFHAAVPVQEKDTSLEILGK